MTEQKTTKGAILIVDDDKFLLDMYALKFGECGYAVDTAFNASDTLEKISGGYVPDIILLDLVMPGMGGFELIEELKNKKLLPAVTTLIILSNRGQKEDIDRGVSLGADGYIVKASATPSEVVSKVEEIKSDKGK